MADSLPPVRPHTVHKLTLIDGTEVDLLITWGLLYRLEIAEPKVFEQVSDYLSGESKRKMMGMTEVLYGAYLCGLINAGGTTEGAMGYVEFLDALPDENGLIEPLNYVQSVIAPKAGRGSAPRSKRARKG